MRFPAAATRDGKAFLDACAAHPAFPAHFGRNWDAWIDVLSGLPPDQPLLLELALDASGASPDADLLRQLAECSAEVNRRQGGAVLRLVFR